MRGTLAGIAGNYGLTILASGTHPTARWDSSVLTDKDRYARVMDDLQMIGRRNMLCGMHVHVALPDLSRRVEVMNRLVPHLPLLIALATSSPFWQGRLTGLEGYRLAAYDELPRTGLPDLFASAGDFQRYVDKMVRAGAMPNASYLWWAIRPSYSYPTLELRAPDSCTRLDDAIAIAALFRALVRHAYYYHEDGVAEPDAVTRAIAQENKWRAQRYGIHGTFVTDAGALPVAEVLERAIAMTAPDAIALNCREEVERCRTILREGTSADAQIRTFLDGAATDGVEAGLAGVVDWIAHNTRSTAGPA